MRQFHLDRIVGQLAKHDYAGVLLFDPLNIRYATDGTNMQLWNTRNAFRACLVTADGHMVLWDYKKLAIPFQTTTRWCGKSRSGAAMFYFATGDRTGDAAARFAAEISSLVAERMGENRRLAVDKVMIAGLHCLDAAGLEVHEGEEVMEHARVIKEPDDILAMRCAMHSCEMSVAAMEEAAAEMTEDDIWAVRTENIRRVRRWIRNGCWHPDCAPTVVRGMRAAGGPEQ